MREYAKLAPTFWTGRTGRALKKHGPEAVVVALYLVSSPHSNMLGLFYQPMLYLVEETGLTQEGASKGLQACIAAGFCSYDTETKTVWVHEMAAWQIDDQLSTGDKRCKGVQRDYDGLPDNLFLAAFFDRYSAAFNMTKRREFVGESEPLARPLQAPCHGVNKPLQKPLASQEQEQEQEQEQSPHTPQGGKKSPAIGLKAWLESVKAKGEKAVPEGDPVFSYAADVGIPEEFLALAWREFRHRYTQPDAKRYRDWRSVFRKAVRGNWLKLWYVGQDGAYGLTTVGHQAQRAPDDRRAA
jgi:hypothetical protein